MSSIAEHKIRLQLQPYRRFPKPNDERKYANRHPGPAFRFLDLPLEPRVIIYKMALVLSRPIELWPECDTPDVAQQHKSIARNFQYLKHKLSRRHFNVGLLRTCKLINYEARDIFYGCNEWRFSGLNGWMVANAFLYTIGANNIKSIKNLTLPMPVVYTFGAMHTLILRGAIVPAMGTRAILRLAKQMPFDLPDCWMYGSSFYDVCAALGVHCANLQTLNLVLPASLELAHLDLIGVSKLFEQVEKLQNRICTR